MMNWELLINETTLALLVPDVYALYRRPLQEALILFLEGLPAKRQEAIAIEQATLPPNSTISERIVLLVRSCPVLHKMGQALARDRNLSAELTSCLQRLESFPPTVPFEAIERVLTQELGPLDRLGVTLMPPALAEASVAVVVPFRFSGREVPLNGVFKVLKPGIEERLEEDLVLLERVGSFLDQRCNDLQIPHLDYRDSFEMVRDKLQYEVRLRTEQHNLTLARDLHKRDPRVRIPALFDLCTPRITAMELVTGQKVTECCPDSGSEKMRMARLVIEALIARPIFSADAEALFHGDPHAGNLFSTKDRRLAILDWSLTGSLGEKGRISIMQIMLGAMAFRADRIVTVLSGLSNWQSIDLPALRSIVYKWIERIRHGHLPGFTWLMGLFDEAVCNAGLRFGADLMLFRKALQMVDGVVTDIAGGSGLIDQVLLSEFVLHFSAEWPWRFFSSPDSHAFSTRVSNTDLAELMLSFPWGAIRFRLEKNYDLLNLAEM
jgi:ubiquinone biosynthesis protein